ncbi:MAG: iron-containing alcohol dehydrogenase [Planctomycetes bacterium]|nr:iron-containing alcohol dehydrogenase [Planctomycetota bacterium]
MKQTFDYYMPTKIIFGPGRLNELEKKANIPGKKALIVISAGGSMKKYGYLDRVINALKINDIDSVVYDKIQPNPISDHVDEGGKVARDEGCDFVIGLGGGSSMDSAKSIAIMAKNPGVYWDYINGGSGGGQPPKEGALPIICITTTAGTGTEADPWTVITKEETQEKIGWGCDHTFPKMSIVDPELMVSIPPVYTAYQGMDAFFHAAEGYLANVNQPASDLHCLSAISLIAKNLPIAVEDGSNIDARGKVAWANTQSGIVESLSCVISHHSLEHAISAIFPDIPHGAGLVSTSVAYFTALAKKSPERFPEMAEAMGEDLTGLNAEEKALAFVTALEKLIAACNLQELRLSDFGVKKADAKNIVDNAYENMGFLFTLDPVKFEAEEMVSIIEACCEN